MSRFLPTNVNGKKKKISLMRTYNAILHNAGDKIAEAFAVKLDHYCNKIW